MSSMSDWKVGQRTVSQGWGRDALLHNASAARGAQPLADTLTKGV